MPGEDQERLEDYLELDHYIEELQTEHAPHPPSELTASQARIYRMVALFRAASPEAASPRPEFVAELRAHLEQELQQPPKPQTFPFLPKRSSKEPQKKQRAARRALLTRGATVAASLVIGAGIGQAVEKIVSRGGQDQGNAGRDEKLVSKAEGTWYFVTTLAALGDRAVRFATDTIVGYVIRDDGDDGDPDKGQIIAMSAACTHMGCLVQWKDSDRKYHCPCHGGVFSEYGKVETSSWPIGSLAPLPRLDTQVVDGKVFVKVPASKK